jgi:hypothetical protein
MTQKEQSNLKFLFEFYFYENDKQGFAFVIHKSLSDAKRLLELLLIDNDYDEKVIASLQDCNNTIRVHESLSNEIYEIVYP